MAEKTRGDEEVEIESRKMSPWRFSVVFFFRREFPAAHRGASKAAFRSLGENIACSSAREEMASRERAEKGGGNARRETTDDQSISGIDSFISQKARSKQPLTSLLRARACVCKEAGLPRESEVSGKSGEMQLALRAQRELSEDEAFRFLFSLGPTTLHSHFALSSFSLQLKRELRESEGSGPFPFAPPRFSSPALSATSRVESSLLSRAPRAPRLARRGGGQRSFSATLFSSLRRSDGR